MATPRKQTSLRVDPRLWELFQKACKDRSVNSVIEDWIRAFLMKENGPAVQDTQPASLGIDGTGDDSVGTHRERRLGLARVLGGVGKRNEIAQTVAYSEAILKRFHLYLKDITANVVRCPDHEAEHREAVRASFAGEPFERGLVMAAAVCALGTRLFGGYGNGKDKDRKELNRAKKQADAVSAYVLSEALTHLCRQLLPENHALFVCQGEGIMPKAGESLELGANPMLGFGRVFARPDVARIVESGVARLLNGEIDLGAFRREISRHSVVLWGAAVDTLENTNRFAKGAESGPSTIIHVFDQTLNIVRPYEGYLGVLTLPRQVVEAAERESILLNYHTPRAYVMRAIEAAGFRPEHVHVWTLRGTGDSLENRRKRIGWIWDEWQRLKANLVEDGWALPNGEKAFTESGSYAPTNLVGEFKELDGSRHLLIVDGYGGTAEALAAASLDPILGLNTSMAVFSSKFALPSNLEWRAMMLDPEKSDFVSDLYRLKGSPCEPEMIEGYRQSIRDARTAGVPLDRSCVTFRDFIPQKEWDVLAVTAAILPEPYSAMPGVEAIGDSQRVHVRLATSGAIREFALTLHLDLPEKQDQIRAFLPLLKRFCEGEPFKERAVTISDGGRIREELQTWFSSNLKHDGDKLRVLWDRINGDVASKEELQKIREVLVWYKDNHPSLLDWLILE